MSRPAMPLRHSVSLIKSARMRLYRTLQAAPLLVKPTASAIWVREAVTRSHDSSVLYTTKRTMTLMQFRLLIHL